MKIYQVSHIGKTFDYITKKKHYLDKNEAIKYADRVFEHYSIKDGIISVTIFEIVISKRQNITDLLNGNIDWDEMYMIYHKAKRSGMDEHE